MTHYPEQIFYYHCVINISGQTMRFKLIDFRYQLVCYRPTVSIVRVISSVGIPTEAPGTFVQKGCQFARDATFNYCQRLRIFDP